MSREQFRQRFAKSPLERPGFDGLRRNAAIVLGNRGESTAVPILITALQQDSALVRGAAAWSLGKLQGEQAHAALRERLPLEQDADVRKELNQALSQFGIRQ